MQTLRRRELLLKEVLPCEDSEKLALEEGELRGLLKPKRICYCPIHKGPMPPAAISSTSWFLIVSELGLPAPVVAEVILWPPKILARPGGR